MTGWSLNEIEALARKATRGAGYAWGLAEEAGRATRWTCAAGWPGAAALADLLTRNDGADPRLLAPQALSSPWTARGACLCPVFSGAALCDLAADWAAGQTLSLGPVAHPMLLVPYMVWAADRTGAPLCLSWQDAQITRRAGETRVDAAHAALSVPHTAQVRLTPAGPPRGSPLVRIYRAAPSTDAVETLTAFAQRTYAPETEQSRLAGAGAGLTDND